MLWMVSNLPHPHNRMHGLKAATREDAMLVLTRRIGERIVIDNNIIIEVMAVQGQRIRLGVSAPAAVRVLREELIAADAEAGVEVPVSR